MLLPVVLNNVSFEQPGPDGKANSVAPIRLVLLIGGPVVFVLMLRTMTVCSGAQNSELA